MLNLKYSKQREIIENAVKFNKIHPTADDIYAILKPDNPNLSLGTVYRNLNSLADSGNILKLSMPDGKSRYDGDISEHSHAICEVCGNIFDADMIETADMDKIVSNKLNMVITSHQFVFYGVCNKCNENKRKERD